ncbi:MAG: glutamine--fructose-6-phosphate transaminase (isomerizing), partial [Chloroflexaceae bacterium]|nr:glutamine--fructose-6-phosphate transaminase (isomerizing) [Chloroflexaceae bacterium]
MCGIVGYVGTRQAQQVVLQGLQRLEYRGYDSAGIAVYDATAGLQIERSVGKLHFLTDRLNGRTLAGQIGLGHTRWATHGAVTEANAHPHRDESGTIVVVQNGIVENYQELKERLIAAGHTFHSQTDTEVIAHLVGAYYRDTHDLTDAVQRTLHDLHGGNAVVAFSIHEPDKLVAARLGNAGGVVIGLGAGETLIASDIPAVLGYTHQLIFLEDGDMAVVSAEGVVLRNREGASIERLPTLVTWDTESAAKGDFDHFMQKEMYEQPRALMDVLRGRVDLEAGTLRLDDLLLDEAQLRGIDRIYAVACGTAWHAALVSKFMIEKLARVRVEVDYGSEFRYRDPVIGAGAMVLAFSQSGETVDTLAAMEEARRQGAPSVAIVNVVGSQAARLADGGALYLHAGPEIGVASTKCFTSMLATAYLLALRLAEVRGTLSAAELAAHIRELGTLPGKAAQTLEKTAAQARMLAERYYTANSTLYLGRQVSYPIALEGALKLKEISYIHA